MRQPSYKVERTELNPAEQKVWEALQARELLGVNFQALHTDGPFQVSFYCPNLRIAIDILEGFQSVPVEMAGDMRPVNHLRDQGIEVIRIRSDEVMNDFDNAMRSIWGRVDARRGGGRS